MILLRRIAPANLLVLVMMVAVIATQPANAYVHGDPVSLVVRTSSRGVTSDWVDLQRHSLPHFGINTATDIIPEFQKKTLKTDFAFKLKFAVSEHRFLIPWITISDGAGMFAKDVVFEIQYMGNDVRNIFVHVESFPEPLSTPPSRIHLKYVWREMPSTDEEMGLRFIFLAGTLTTLVVLISVLCSAS